MQHENPAIPETRGTAAVRNQENGIVSPSRGRIPLLNGALCAAPHAGRSNRSEECLLGHLNANPDQTALHAEACVID